MLFVFIHTLNIAPFEGLSKALRSLGLSDVKVHSEQYVRLFFNHAPITGRIIICRGPMLTVSVYLSVHVCARVCCASRKC